MKEEKIILDATAGYRMMWFNKDNPNVVYLDQRGDDQLIRDGIRDNWIPLIPTTKGDFRDLSQFPDESFRLIVFDPPHLQWLGETSIFKKKFGQLQKETWPKDIKSGAAELWRVLMPYGVLIFKWNDHDIDYRKLLKLFPTKPLFGQITAGSRGKTGKGRSNSFWFCFMKIPNNLSV
jgi:hypothetical protein